MKFDEDLMDTFTTAGLFTPEPKRIDYALIGITMCAPVMFAVALLFTFLSMISLHHFVNDWVLLAGGAILALGSLVGTLKFFFWLDLKQY